MTITETIKAWRSDWCRQQIRYGLSKGEDQDWKEYLDSLSISEVIENLSLYEES